MRFVLASCPASTPPDQAFLLYTLDGVPVPGRKFTPVPCWSPGCSGPHPLVEVDAATALGTLTRAVRSSETVRRRPAPLFDAVSVTGASISTADGL